MFSFLLPQRRRERKDYAEKIKAKDKKLLTGSLVLFYTKQLAPRECVQHERRISMLTMTKHKEQTMKWQPCAAMYSFVCSLGVMASTTSILGDRPGFQISENRRNSRH
jgi:hypothetical protein